MTTYAPDNKEKDSSYAMQGTADAYDQKSTSETVVEVAKPDATETKEQPTDTVSKANQTAAAVEEIPGRKNGAIAIVVITIVILIIIVVITVYCLRKRSGGKDKEQDHLEMKESEKVEAPASDQKDAPKEADKNEDA